jgi:hypothetical protein
MGPISPRTCCIFFEFCTPLGPEAVRAAWRWRSAKLGRIKRALFMPGSARPFLPWCGARVRVSGVARCAPPRLTEPAPPALARWPGFCPTFENF